MIKINVYLDDVRKCPKGFILARTAEEALKLIREGHVAVLSLDHDLAINEKEKERLTGYDLMKTFCEEELYVDEVYMYTDNVVGRNNMYETLLAAHRRGFISKNIKI